MSPGALTAGIHLPQAGPAASGEAMTRSAVLAEELGYADEDGPSLAGLFRQQYRGSRYSWGYPACPELDDQVKVAELLDVERIGVSLTEEFHLVPEQSTSAIIVPHPEAKYFVV